MRHCARYENVVCWLQLRLWWCCVGDLHSTPQAATVRWLNNCSRACALQASVEGSQKGGYNKKAVAGALEAALPAGVSLTESDLRGYAIECAHAPLDCVFACKSLCSAL